MKKIHCIAVLLSICTLLPLYHAEAQSTRRHSTPRQYKTDNKRTQDKSWFTNMDDAVAAARRTRTPILINFTGSDWCGWCIRLDKEVFSRPEFKKFAARNLVLLKVDFPRRKWQTPAEKKANRELAMQYGVRGYPTIILINADGQLIARTGYRKGGASSYVRHLKDLIRKR